MSDDKRTMRTLPDGRPLASFDSWQGVLDHVNQGGLLWYYAPLDYRPTFVLVRKVFKNGKIRLSAGEITFTADAGHLSRMRKHA